MTLELFLNTLVSELETNNIKYCILRNYETLPTVLKKGDIDFLVSEEHLGKIAEIIKSIQGIHIIGVTKRQYVNNYFIYNIDKGGDSRALQIDFVFKYIYKGVSYLDIPSTLNSVRIEKNKQFYIPSKFDETFFMFFPFYLSTGTLNKKYENIIVAVFKEYEKEFKSFFIKLNLEKSLIDDLYAATINKNNSLLLDLSSDIKQKVFLHNFKLMPMFSHFFREIILRLPLVNSRIIKVTLNPKEKKEIYKSLDSFAKNIIFVDKKNVFNYFKIFTIQTNFTMYVFYEKNTSISHVEILNEIISCIAFKTQDTKLNSISSEGTI